MLPIAGNRPEHGPRPDHTFIFTSWGNAMSHAGVWLAVSLLALMSGTTATACEEGTRACMQGNIMVCLCGGVPKQCQWYNTQEGCHSSVMNDRTLRRRSIENFGHSVFPHATWSLLDITGANKDIDMNPYITNKIH
jgi:hypothetical protein